MPALAEQITTITAGESIAATIAYADYPRSLGWALHVGMSGDGWTASHACIDGAGTDDFLFAVPFATTAAWLGGLAAFIVWATLGDERKRAEQGTFRVLADPAAPTRNQTTLTAIRALIAGRATDDQRTVSFEGVSFSYLAPADLLKWEVVFASRVAAEIRARSAGSLRQSIRYILPV